MDLFHSSWKWRKDLCPNRELSLGPQWCFSPGQCAPCFLAKRRDSHNTSFHMRYSQKPARRKESLIFCFSIFMLFPRGVTIALASDEEWGCPHLNSSECGPSYPLREGVYNALLRNYQQQSIWWTANNVLESFLLGCFIIRCFLGAGSHLLV